MLKPLCSLVVHVSLGGEGWGGLESYSLSIFCALPCQDKAENPIFPADCSPKPFLDWIPELTLTLSIRQSRPTFMKMWAQHTCLETEIYVLRYLDIDYACFRSQVRMKYEVLLYHFRAEESLYLLPFIQLTGHILEVFWLFIIFSYRKFVITSFLYVLLQPATYWNAATERPKMS